MFDTVDGMNLEQKLNSNIGCFEILTAALGPNFSKS